MGKTRYGKDASACESARDLDTEKWISVVRHSLGLGFVRDRFGYFDSKGEGDDYSAEVAKSFNDPGLSKRATKAYKDAMSRRSEVLASTSRWVAFRMGA